MEQHAGNAERVLGLANHHLSSIRRLRHRHRGERCTHHLLRSHTDRLDGELAPAHVEQVLEARPQQVDDEDVVQPFLPEVVYLGYPRCACPAVVVASEKTMCRRRSGAPLKKPCAVED